MITSRRLFLRAMMGLGAVALATGIYSPVYANDPVVKMGVSNSLLRMNGISSPNVAMIQMQPLAELFATQGNKKINFQFGELLDLGKEVSEGKTHFAVVPGIEYAWIQKKYPDVQPLALAMKQSVELRAYVMVPQDSSASRFTELKGLRLALPRKNPHHCQVFLQNQICCCGQKPESFFTNEIVQDIETAIDGTIEHRYEAVIVDKGAWDVYSESKPGRARRLKVMIESPPFPTAAVIYKPGVMDRNEVDYLKRGMLTAHEKVGTKLLLTFWKLSKFTEPTPQYAQLCNSIVQTIPQPIELVNFNSK